MKREELIWLSNKKKRKLTEKEIKELDNIIKRGYVSDKISIYTRKREKLKKEKESIIGTNKSFFSNQTKDIKELRKK